MPLKITLKPAEKVIINGAVIENGDREATLIFHNNATFLRQKDILAEQDAVTPASRVYFALQCLYIFPDQRDRYSELLNQLLTDYIDAAPSAEPIATTIREHQQRGEYYQALRDARRLVDHERERLDNVYQAVSERLSDDPSAG